MPLLSVQKGTFHFYFGLEAKLLPNKKQDQDLPVPYMCTVLETFTTVDLIIFWCQYLTLMLVVYFPWMMHEYLYNQRYEIFHKHRVYYYFDGFFCACQCLLVYIFMQLFVIHNRYHCWRYSLFASIIGNIVIGGSMVFIVRYYLSQENAFLLQDTFTFGCDIFDCGFFVNAYVFFAVIYTTFFPFVTILIYNYALDPTHCKFLDKAADNQVQIDSNAPLLVSNSNSKTNVVGYNYQTQDLSTAMMTENRESKISDYNQTRIARPTAASSTVTKQLLATDDALNILDSDNTVATVDQDALLVANPQPSQPTNTSDENKGVEEILQNFNSECKQTK